MEKAIVIEQFAAEGKSVVRGMRAKIGCLAVSKRLDTSDAGNPIM
jgi:hypothetical protein